MRYDQGDAREHNSVGNFMDHTTAGREVVDGIEGAFVVVAGTLDQDLGRPRDVPVRRTRSTRTFGGSLQTGEGTR